MNIRTSPARSITTPAAALAPANSTGLDDIPTRYTRSASHVNPLAAARLCAMRASFSWPRSIHLFTAMEFY